MTRKKITPNNTVQFTQCPKCYNVNQLQTLSVHVGYFTVPNSFNPLPNDKFLVVTKLTAFADNKLNVAKMTIFLFARAENTVGKGENAIYQHFLLFL